MIVFLYRIMWWVMTPLLPFYLWWRQMRGKEEANFIGDRYGRGRGDREEGGEGGKENKTIWVHAASVGEVNSIVPLIERLCDIYDKAQHGEQNKGRRGGRVLLTTSSRNGQEIARRSLPSSVWLRYLPLDHPLFVRRFLHYYRPAVALWVEQELWPNMLLQASKMGVKMLLVNGRLTEKSLRRWRRLGDFAKRLGEVFDVILAGSILDRDNFRTMGWHADYRGNLKAFGGSHSERGDGREADILLRYLREKWGKNGGEGWLAASVHAGEDKLCFAAHNILREKNGGGGGEEGGGLVVVPRYPKQAKSMCREAGRHGLSAVLYSELLKDRGGEDGEGDYANCNCVVVDSFGLLGALYGHFGVCFLGGSCGAAILGDNLGGHNPLEAVAGGCVVISGADMRNFSYISDGLKEAGVLISLAANSQDFPHMLAYELRKFLNDDNLRLCAVDDGRRKLKDLSGEAESMVDFVLTQLGKTL